MRALANWILLRTRTLFIWSARVRGRLEAFKLLFASDPIFYVGYNFRLNFGDDLLLAVFREICPAPVIASIDVPRCILPKRARVVLGGGTIINGPIYLNALRRFRSPIYLGSFYSGVIGGQLEPEWHEVLRNFNFISVRSQESKDALGVLRSRAVSHVDPGMLVANRHILSRPLNRVSKGEKARLILNLHHKGEIAQFLIKNPAALKELRERFDIVFFLASPVDISCLEGLIHLRDNIVFAYIGVDRALLSIRESDLVISERLHVGVAAVALGTPVLAFRYDPKCEEFFKSIHLEHLLYRSVSTLLESAMQFSNSETLPPAAVREICDGFHLEIFGAGKR